MRQSNNNYTPEGFFVSIHKNLANSIKAEGGLRVGSTGLNAPVAALRYERSHLSLHIVYKDIWTKCLLQHLVFPGASLLFFPNKYLMDNISIFATFFFFK